MQTCPHGTEHPGGVQDRGISIPGRWQHTWGPPCCGTAGALGGLQPCWQLSWINKQIRGFVGFSTEQHQWGDARGGGRRPWPDPRRRELPGAAVLPITARERGYRLRCKHRRAGARQPLRSSLPCRCFLLPSQTLPTLPGAAGMLLPSRKARPRASRGAGDAACWESLSPCYSPTLLGCFRGPVGAVLPPQAATSILAYSWAHD